jgi:hypothetical protein
MAGRKPTVSDDEILQVFLNSSDPVLTTSEVAEAINLGRRGTFDRLDQLADQGQLHHKEVGNAGMVWWSPQALSEQYRESTQ